MDALQLQLENLRLQQALIQANAMILQFQYDDLARTIAALEAEIKKPAVE